MAIELTKLIGKPAVRGTFGMLLSMIYRMSVFLQKYINMCIYTCICVCIYICMYMCIYIYIYIYIYICIGFPSSPAVKNLPEMQETQVQSLGWKDPLEEGMATHSSILAWRIPWTEKPVGLYSPWGPKSQA